MEMFSFTLESPFVYAVTTVVVCTGSILYAKRYIERKQRELETRFRKERKEEKKEDKKEKEKNAKKKSEPGEEQKTQKPGENATEDEKKVPESDEREDSKSESGSSEEGIKDFTPKNTVRQVMDNMAKEGLDKKADLLGQGAEAQSLMKVKKIQDPMDFCDHLPSEIKKTRQRVTMKVIENKMSEAEKELETCTKEEQINNILAMMEEKEEWFEGVTREEIDEQMKLYAQ